MASNITKRYSKKNPNYVKTGKETDVKKDKVMTPDYLAKSIIEHYKPNGFCLEPCKGTGNIYKYLPRPKDWCEIDEGRNFFDWTKKVDWIITNPPWANMTMFLDHCYEVAENVVFVMLSHHLWTKKRMNSFIDKNFIMREMLLIPTPPRP